MDETAATATAQPGAQPGSATGETLVLSVDDAAQLIGITPQAVRKRIAKGALAAHRDGRAWRVVLERGAIATGETETPQPRTQPPTKPGSQPVQPQAAQLAALVEPFTTPLVERIEALSREAERERVRADGAERDRDRLAAEVARDRGLADQLVDLLQEERDAARRRVAELVAPVGIVAADPAAGRSPPSGPREPIGAPAWRERSARAVDVDEPAAAVTWWRRLRDRIVGRK